MKVFGPVTQAPSCRGCGLGATEGARAVCQAPDRRSSALRSCETWLNSRRDPGFQRTQEQAQSGCRLQVRWRKFPEVHHLLTFPSRKTNLRRKSPRLPLSPLPFRPFRLSSGAGRCFNLLLLVD